MAIMRPLFISVLLLVAAVLGLDDSITFVSPGPSSSDHDYSLNTIHRIRSNFHVAWDGTNSSRPVSIVLFQSNGTDLVYPFEYVQQSMVNRFSYDWTVVTNKDLSFSHLFLFNIFYDGELDPVAVSQKFNITDSSENPSTTSDSTSTTSATRPTSSATSASATFTPSTAATSAAPVPTASTDPDQSGGLSTGAKVGIGIAVAVLALGGIAAGYFLYRHRAKKQQQGVAAALAAGGSPVPKEQKRAGSVADHPHEMDSLHSHSMLHELDGGATRR